VWILQGKHCGDAYGFPFDRPLLVFAERILKGHKHLSNLLAYCQEKDDICKKAIIQLAQIISDLNDDFRFHQGIQELRWRCLVFDNLRKAMRIAPLGGRNGLNDDGTSEAMTTIRAGVEQFRKKLDNNKKWSADTLCQKMAKQIDKWNTKLFADPIEVNSPNGPVTIYPQRTNNILEQFFRGIRRGQRRKTGNNSIRQMLQTMIADTPLVKNLDNAEYMKILLGGKTNLEELFADLEMSVITISVGHNIEIGRLLPGFRKLIAQKNMPEQVVQLLCENQIKVKSN
jgi:hypothetical protein